MNMDIGSASDSSSSDDSDEPSFSEKATTASSSSSSSTSTSSSTSSSSEDDDDVEQPQRKQQPGRPLACTINPITNRNIHMMCKTTQFFYDFYQPCGQRVAAHLRVLVSINGQACFGLQLSTGVKLSAFMSAFVPKFLRNRYLPIAMEIDALPLGWVTAENTRNISSIDAIPAVVDELTAAHSDKTTEGCFIEPITVEMVSGKCLHVAFFSRLFGKPPWEGDSAFVTPPPSDEEIIEKMQQLVEDATKSAKATYEFAETESKVLTEMKEMQEQIVRITEEDNEKMRKYHKSFELAMGKLLEKMTRPPTPPPLAPPPLLPPAPVVMKTEDVFKKPVAKSREDDRTRSKSLCHEKEKEKEKKESHSRARSNSSSSRSRSKPSEEELFSSFAMIKKERAVEVPKPQEVLVKHEKGVIEPPVAVKQEKKSSSRYSSSTSSTPSRSSSRASSSRTKTTKEEEAARVKIENERKLEAEQKRLSSRASAPAGIQERAPLFADVVAGFNKRKTLDVASSPWNSRKRNVHQPPAVVDPPPPPPPEPTPVSRVKTLLPRMPPRFPPR